MRQEQARLETVEVGHADTAGQDAMQQHGPGDIHVVVVVVFEFVFVFVMRASGARMRSSL